MCAYVLCAAGTCADGCAAVAPSNPPAPAPLLVPTSQPATPDPHAAAAAALAAQAGLGGFGALSAVGVPGGAVGGGAAGAAAAMAAAVAAAGGAGMGGVGMGAAGGGGGGAGGGAGKPDLPVIIYSSRTHSQLAQVMKELRNCSYK